jgi:hypothetical protein
MPKRRTERQRDRLTAGVMAGATSPNRGIPHDARNGIRSVAGNFS